MKLTWEIEPEDVKRVKSFLAAHKSSPFVQRRIDNGDGVIE